MAQVSGEEDLGMDTDNPNQASDSELRDLVTCSSRSYIHVHIHHSETQIIPIS